MAGDIIAARRAARAYAKYALRKITFTDRLWGKRGATVSARTQFIYNTQTEVCNPSCALWVGGRAIYPTKQELRSVHGVRRTLMWNPYHHEERGLWVYLPKKHGFQVDSDIVVTVAANPTTNVVTTVRGSQHTLYATIPKNISPLFAYGVAVDVAPAQKTGKRVLEFMGRYEQGTATEINLQYARAYDEYDVYIGEMSVQAEIHPERRDVIWTGKVEVCFRPANSPELILLDTVSAKVSRTNLRRSVWKAIAIIRQYYVAAKEWSKEER